MARCFTRSGSGVAEPEALLPDESSKLRTKSVRSGHNFRIPDHLDVAPIGSADILLPGLPHHFDEHLPCLLGISDLVEEVDANAFDTILRLQTKRES
jgi:hypothetical protein